MHDEETTRIPRVPPQPTKLERTPIEPWQRAWLYGVILSLLLLLGTIVVTTNIITNSDDAEAREKSQQVKDCTTIEDSGAALLCVHQIDE